MGPRPGCDILRVRQGIVEICLRVATVVSNFYLYNIYSYSVSTNASLLLPRIQVFALATAAAAALVIYNIQDSGIEDSGGSDLVKNTRGVAGWFILASVTTIVFQLLMTALRFLNIGCINKYIGIVLIVVSSRN